MSGRQRQGSEGFGQGLDGSGVGVDADARRLAVEAIATLVNVKKSAAEQLLRRAGVPDDLVRRFLTERNPATGEKRSKREAGTAVRDELARAGADGAVVRRPISIAAAWDAFHLAQDEYKARAVVRKARELSSVLADPDAREKAAQDLGAREPAGVGADLARQLGIACPGGCLGR